MMRGRFILNSSWKTTINESNKGANLPVFSIFFFIRSAARSATGFRTIHQVNPGKHTNLHNLVINLINLVY